MFRKKLLLSLLLFLLSVFYLEAIEYSNLLLVKSMGDDYIVLDKSDPYYKKMINLINSTPELQNVILNYERVQLKKQVRLYNELKQKGLSKDKIELVMRNHKTKPLIWNLTSYDGGNSMEVGSFTVISKDAKGKTIKIKYKDTPIVNLAMNGETMKGEKSDIVRSIAHETGHGIMSIFYGGTFPYSEHYGEPHWRSKVTDKGLALVEGWAEMNGPLFSTKSEYRQRIANGEYIYTMDGSALKKYREMLATEGYVASVLFDIVQGIDDGYDKILYVFEKDNPQGIGQLVRSLEKRFPQDAYQVYKIVTYNSRGANVNEIEAQKMYKKYLNGQLPSDAYQNWLDKVTDEGWAKEAKLLGLKSWKNPKRKSPTGSLPAIDYGNQSGTVIKNNWDF